MARDQIKNLEILSGWKRIADYLGKGVRTIQRYERELGLPIRRPAGKLAGSVIATRAEIDAWLEASALRDSFTLSIHGVDSTEIGKELKQQVMELHRLKAKSAELRDETVELRSQMCAAREALGESIQLLHESLFIAAENSQLSSMRRTADVLTSDPKRKAN